MTAAPSDATTSPGSSAQSMRLFIFARHAESALNAAGLLGSDPSRPTGLTPHGTEQARRLGQQLANVNIDLAVATRFLRTRETVELALQGRDIPLLVEPDLDEIRAGGFDGKPLSAYWAWRDEHGRGERFPDGESLDDAVRRYADALWRLLGRSEAVTLIVGHELAIRYIVEAAAGANTLGLSEMRIANATPYLLDETALRTAAARLDALASPAPRTESRTEVAASTRPVKTKDVLDSTHPGGFAEQPHLADSGARRSSRRERLVLRRQDRDRAVNLEGGGNEHN
jgi:broad specificity phosphatase PhoE